MISIIIPVLNEEKSLAQCLDRVFAQKGDYQVIIVDGGSQDSTAQIARAYPAQFISTIKGRGSQMNAGAKIAQGQWLLFLHADTLLEADTIEKLSKLSLEPKLQAGCFWHRFDSLHPWLQIVSLIHNLRFRFTGIIYGDQCLFIRRDLFQQLGGFKEIVMEDIEFSERLKKVIRPCCLPIKAVTSARKFRALGIYRATFRVLVLMYAYGRKDARHDLFFSDIR